MSQPKGVAGTGSGSPPPPPPPPPSAPCPHCGLPTLLLFGDGSGRCQSCGQIIRGRGRLQESGGAVAGLAKETGPSGPPADNEFRRSKLIVGALAAAGGIALILAVPLGAVLSASLSRIPIETRFVSLFASYAAIGFCLLGLSLLLLGFYSILLGYRHAVGEIPLGTALLFAGFIGLAASAVMIYMLGSMVTVVGGVGGGLLIGAGVMDKQLG